VPINGYPNLEVRYGSRPCEKTVAGNYWAIYCRRAASRHGEDFGYTILREIELLVFGTVKTFRTASVERGLEAGYQV
jgi:hypothetical protein